MLSKEVRDLKAHMQVIRRQVAIKNSYKHGNKGIDLKGVESNFHAILRDLKRLDKELAQFKETTNLIATL